MPIRLIETTYANNISSRVRTQHKSSMFRFLIICFMAFDDSGLLAQNALLT